MYQLGIYRRDRGQDYIKLMLSGEKTVDIKLSNRRITPYKKILPNDILLIKESSGPIVGACKIEWVEDIDFGKTKEKLFPILMKYWKQLGLRDEEHVFRMYEKTNHNRFVTLFALSNPIEFATPVWIEKHDRRAWISNYRPPTYIDFVLKSETCSM